MSKEVSHTPGPWHVQNLVDIYTGLGATNASGFTAGQNDGWQIASMGGATYTATGEFDEIPIDEQKANAQLIAAAPEMLEVLLECRAKLEQAMADGFLQSGITETIIRADIAIEKATGK